MDGPLRSDALLNWQKREIYRQDLGDERPCKSKAATSVFVESFQKYLRALFCAMGKASADPRLIQLIKFDPSLLSYSKSNKIYDSVVSWLLRKASSEAPSARRGYVDPILGTIFTFAFNFAPQGYASCLGQILSIQQNSALFSLLGTTYGGNGQTTFALPNLGGRVAVGQGQSPGTSTYTIGQMAGTENVTLLQSNLPAHTHAASLTGTLNAVNIKATEPSPAAGRYLARSVDAATNPTANPEIYVPAEAGDPADKVALAGLNVAGTIGVTGNNQPFSICQPYLTLNPCIALQGIFPSRP